MAFAWSLSVAPLAHPTGAAGAFAPSTSMPVAPQFLRLAITRKRVIIGAEAPYVAAPKLAPPIRIQQPTHRVSQPVVEADPRHVKHDLRGPEALLLRRPQSVVSKTLP